MSDCLNPDCVTDYPVLSWLDPDYCSDACRRVHGPISGREPETVCARPACGQPIAISLDGYCSDRCVRLDTPAPVEAWAAATGRAIDGGPIGAAEPDAPVPPPVLAVDSLEPASVGAESTGPLSEPQGSTLTREQVAAAMDVPVESVGRGPGGTFVIPARPEPYPVADGLTPSERLSGYSVASQPTGRLVRARRLTNPPKLQRPWWARLLRRTA